MEESPPRTPKPELGSEVVWLCQHIASGIKFSTVPWLSPRIFTRGPPTPVGRKGHMVSKTWYLLAEGVEERSTSLL